MRMMGMTELCEVCGKRFVNTTNLKITICAECRLWEKVDEYYKLLRRRDE
jgi:ribosomal protein L37AE/L43A